MARLDFDAARESLRRIIRELGEAVERGDLAGETAGMVAEAREVAGRLQADCADLIELLEELLERGPGQEPDLGARVMARAQTAEEGARRGRKKWRGRVWDTIWAELKTALKRIWSMICELLTVKEWTVSGQLSTGVLGFAQAGVSVTFGK